MKMNIMEKKALYTFGCPNRKATVDRLRLLAAITPDPAAGKLFCNLAVKLSAVGVGEYNAELTMRLAEVSTYDMEGDYGEADEV